LHIVEEGPADGEFSPHAAVHLVTQIESGVKQEGQQIAVQEFTRGRVRDRDFAPIDVERLAIGPQGRSDSPRFRSCGRSSTAG
jgi:hypothetical protein